MAFDLRQTIISIIRYGEMEEKAKAKLLELMKYTSACFVRSDEWSGYHAMWHKKEYVELRIIPEKWKNYVSINLNWTFSVAKFIRTMIIIHMRGF